MAEYNSKVSFKARYKKENEVDKGGYREINGQIDIFRETDNWI